MWVQMATWMVGDGQQPRPGTEASDPVISRASGLRDSPIGMLCQAVHAAGAIIASAPDVPGAVSLRVTVAHREPGAVVLCHQGIAFGAVWVDDPRDIADLVPEVGGVCVVDGTMYVLPEHEQATWFGSVDERLTCAWVVEDIRAEFLSPRESVRLECIDAESDAWASNFGTASDGLGGCDDECSRPAGAHADGFGWFSYSSPAPQRHPVFWLDLHPVSGWWPTGTAGAGKAL